MERAPGSASASKTLGFLLGVGLGVFWSRWALDEAPQKGDPKPSTPADANPGGAAVTPALPPRRGWKCILLKTYRGMDENRILAVAGGVTFFGLLALFPAVAAIVSVYGLFADAGTINDHLASLQGVLPSGALDLIGDQVKRIASKGNSTLGLAFIFGLAISLWSANSGMKATFDALNIAYGLKEKRGFVSLNLRSLAFTLAMIVFALTAIAAIVVTPIALKLIGLEGATKLLISLGRWPVLVMISLFGIALLYYFGPSPTPTAKWRWISPGAILVTIVWLAFSALFSWYVANFGKYNETYGGLGAAIGFMTWMWLSATILLAGAEFNSAIEK